MPLTSFLAQLIGLFCLITGALILFRKKVYADIIDGLYTEPTAVFLPGLAALLIGLMLVLSHDDWTDGIPAIAVTLVGWAILVKGIVLLFFPNMATRMIEILRIKQWSWIYGGIVLLIGAYLTYAGFTG